MTDTKKRIENLEAEFSAHASAARENKELHEAQEEVWQQAAAAISRIAREIEPEPAEMRAVYRQVVRRLSKIGSIDHIPFKDRRCQICGDEEQLTAYPTKCAYCGVHTSPSLDRTVDVVPSLYRDWIARKVFQVIDANQRPECRHLKVAYVLLYEASGAYDLSREQIVALNEHRAALGKLSKLDEEALDALHDELRGLGLPVQDVDHLDKEYPTPVFSY